MLVVADSSPLIVLIDIGHIGSEKCEKDLMVDDSFPARVLNFGAERS